MKLLSSHSVRRNIGQNTAILGATSLLASVMVYTNSFARKIRSDSALDTGAVQMPNKIRRNMQVAKRSLLQRTGVSCLVYEAF